MTIANPSHRSTTTTAPVMLAVIPLLRTGAEPSRACARAAGEVGYERSSPRDRRGRPWGRRSCWPFAYAGLQRRSGFVRRVSRGRGERYLIGSQLAPETSACSCRKSPRSRSPGAEGWGVTPPPLPHLLPPPPPPPPLRSDRDVRTTLGTFGTMDTCETARTSRSSSFNIYDGCVMTSPTTLTHRHHHCSRPASATDQRYFSLVAPPHHCIALPSPPPPGHSPRSETNQARPARSATFTTTSSRVDGGHAHRRAVPRPLRRHRSH